MFSRFFEHEIRLLRDLARRFAGAHAKTAGRLGEDGRDPDVERLLEGLAFVTARIRERLDAEIPAVVRELTSLLLPHYLRSIPACSVVEFSPTSKLCRRQPVPAGAGVSAGAIGGTSCQFRTALPFDLLPLTLESSSLEGAQSANPLLRMVFQSSPDGVAQVFDEAGLRLFLHGEFAVTSTLWLWFVRHCREVTVRDLCGSGRAVTLGPEVVHPVGFDPEEALLPWPRLAPDGYRLVQEYFTLPQKFLFLDLRPMSAAREAAAERFEIAFRFERPPELPGWLGPGSFRLGCCPVINLFSATAEPILSELPGAEHVLRPAGVKPAHAEVYGVQLVEGLRRGEAGRKRYAPFFGYSHVGEKGNLPAFYRLRQERAPGGDGLDTFLSVSTPRDVAPDLREEVLSVDLTCTNRALAGQVRSGDLCTPTPSSPEGSSFKNLLPATPPTLPPLATAHWRLINHLAIVKRSLQSAQALRALLSLYDFQRAADPQGGGVRNKVDAIQSLETRNVLRTFEGATVRGVSIAIDLEETSFASRGEAVLFGSIINELFASRVAIGAFTELTIRLQPSRAEYAWPARNGSQVLA